MSENRQYDPEYKVQAVKLAKETSTKRAAEELKIPYNTLSGWVRQAKDGLLDLGGGENPNQALSLAAEIQMLKKKNRELEKEIRRIQEENEILAEAAAFFAASRRKSAKKND